MSTNIDWQTRPWGKPVITCVTDEYYASTGVAAFVSFRYHNIRTRGWRLFVEGNECRLEAPSVDDCGPHVTRHLGPNDTSNGGTYFMSKEDDRLFKSDLEALLDFTAVYGLVHRWVEGTKIK